MLAYKITVTCAGIHGGLVNCKDVGLSTHVVLEDLSHWDNILADLRSLLQQRYDIKHVTLQPETTTHVVRFEGH